MSDVRASSIATRRPPRIDAHHHLWRYHKEDFEWITDDMPMLRRDFTPEHLAHEMASADIDGTIAVQARRTSFETDFLLACARESNLIMGVVGWVPLTSSEVGTILDRYVSEPYFVGVREIAQGHSPGFLDDTDLNSGIRELTARHLSYDILIYANQLEEATRLADRHPQQRFVLDHAAKPLIAANELEPWRKSIHSLALRPNVSCKLSGLVTEADWKHWTPATLAPFIDTCVEAFTPSRLLAGSDWPVCLLASKYKLWWETLRDYFATFTAEEQAAVFGLNAERIYQLPRRATA